MQSFTRRFILSSGDIFFIRDFYLGLKEIVRIKSSLIRGKEMRDVKNPV